MNNQNPYSNLVRSDLNNRIRLVLTTLTVKEERILRMHFGFDGEPKNIEEVADSFFVTRERVRQIMIKALRKLRHPSRSQLISEYKEFDWLDD